MNIFDLDPEELSNKELLRKQNIEKFREIERLRTLQELDEREISDNRRIELHGWFTYFMANLQRNIVKIGKSRNVAERHETLEIIYQMKLQIIYVEMGDKETYYHDVFAADRIGREFFELSDAIVEFVQRVK